MSKEITKKQIIKATVTQFDKDFINKMKDYMSLSEAEIITLAIYNPDYYFVKYTDFIKNYKGKI